MDLIIEKNYIKLGLVHCFHVKGISKQEHYVHTLKIFISVVKYTILKLCL